MVSSRRNEGGMISPGDLFEGQLLKWTNAFKGFQFRWFLLDASRGTLEYFLPDERRRAHLRGCVYLAGSIINPSEEDGQTFTVAAVTGISYKLKATDPKERQVWVSKLRQVALFHDTDLETPGLRNLQSPAGKSLTDLPSASSASSAFSGVPSSFPSDIPTAIQAQGEGSKSNNNNNIRSSWSDAPDIDPDRNKNISQVASQMNAIRTSLHQAQRKHRQLIESIESYTSSDPQILLLKATSHSAVMCLEQSYAILQAIQHHRLT